MFILVFILTLLSLVVIHEFGHFIVAKRFNIKVLEFGFGLPPRVFGKKVGETLVSLNWLPFGGFVRLLGEDEVDKKALDDKRSFAYQDVWKRMAVVVAGVVMNMLLAWVLFYIVIIYNGFKVILPVAEPVVIVEQVADNTPAKQAGLKGGDRILSVNNDPVHNPDQFLADIKKNVGKKTTLLVGDWQGQNSRQLTITPRANPPSGQGALGVSISPFAVREFKTPVEKILAGPIYSWDLIKISVPQTGKLFADLFAGRIDKASEQVAGPVGIVAITGKILSNGWNSIIPYLFFMGMLSLNLSVVNILPFPGLDGGRFFFLIIEAITRKKTHPVDEKYVHAAGLAILLTLIILISISDIRKIIINNPLYQ